MIHAEAIFEFYSVPLNDQPFYDIALVQLDIEPR
jgi:hypothetical protein